MFQPVNRPIAHDKEAIAVHRNVMTEARQILSTSAVPASHMLPYWRDLICDIFVDLSCEMIEPRAFHGQIEQWRAADLAYTRVNSNAHKVARDRKRISRSTDDHFLLSLQIRGTGSLRQDGRSTILKPGDFAVYDVTRPYNLMFDNEFEQVVMQIPREQLSSRLLDIDQLTAVGVSGRDGAGRLASTLIAQTASQLDNLDTESLQQAQACVLDLTANALASSKGKRSEIVSESQELTIRRILHHIENSLGDPSLTCERVAAENGISERYLRKLFQNKGHSVSEWIWMRRLECAKADLVNPRFSHRSVSSIAYEWGFKDTAHFSRAFRNRFDQSPRAIRTQRVSNQTTVLD
ncbi:MAG: helix-turn-helix domain-containing protein [Parvularcula sp.]|nr:helix-turn-helix domain-containing protein [Parvularcula sp.]